LPVKKPSDFQIGFIAEIVTIKLKSLSAYAPATVSGGLPRDIGDSSTISLLDRLRKDSDERQQEEMIGRMNRPLDESLKHIEAHLARRHHPNRPW